MTRYILAAFVLAMAGSVSAQTDPRTLPRFDTAAITSLGTITIPSRDSRGNLINYGAGASGFSEDGTRLFVGCHGLANTGGYNARGMIWTGTIPAIGSMSKELAPCTGLPDSELHEISGNPNMTSPLIGGVIQKGGRYILNGYITYDASGHNPRKTWWVGPSLSQLTGPVEGSVRNGLVMMGTSRIPVEWQPLLGGDVGVTAGYSSIISRASYGSSFTTFWSKDVGATGFPMNFLLGCPSNDPATGAALPQCTSNYTEGTQSLTKYNGGEKVAAVFIVPSTRTLMVILREGKGPMCYGYATTDKSLHGTIRPGPEGVHWCWSLSGDPFQKGMHAYPYVHLALSYDLNDLLAVKQGTKKPWDVVPYATHTMPGSTDSFDVGYTGSGAFNTFTGQYYLLREAYPNGNGGADIEVWGGWPKEGNQPPPPDRNCVETSGLWGPGAQPEGWSACTAGSRFRDRTWTTTVAQSGKGQACVFTGAGPVGTKANEHVTDTTGCQPPPSNHSQFRLESTRCFRYGGLDDPHDPART